MLIICTSLVTVSSLIFSYKFLKNENGPPIDRKMILKSIEERRRVLERNRQEWLITCKNSKERRSATARILEIDQKLIDLSDELKNIK